MSELSIELRLRNNKKPTKFELKGKSIEPCPFCGSEDIYIVDQSDIDMCWCGCATCGTEGPVRPERRYAIDRWQIRR